MLEWLRPEAKCDALRSRRLGDTAAYRESIPKRGPDRCSRKRIGSEGRSQREKTRKPAISLQSARNTGIDE